MSTSAKGGPGDGAPLISDTLAAGSPPASPSDAKPAARGFVVAQAQRPAPSPPLPLFTRGTLLSGTYEILRLVATGGMGQVFEARDVKLNRLVAIKVARPEVGATALIEEARALAAFRHPGLVGVHALGNHAGTDFIVMELLSGVNLADHLDHRAARNPFSIDETLEILLGVADALAVLHAAGLAHRDLKPENIILAPRGRVVLLDLGIVRQERYIADEDTLSGSPLYIAPESVVSKVNVGEAHLVDVYALGVIAFEMLVGAPPFEGTQPLEILSQHIHTAAPHPSTLRPDIPPALDRLIVEMLAKRPDDRPSSIDVVIASLRSIRAALSQPVPGRPLDVLIVDDDADMRKLLDAIVRQSAPSATVRFAENGEQALRLFHEHPPDAMLLDLQMPVMNGMEVCMYLRGTSLADHTAICVVSSFADSNQELLEQLGVADVIAKKHRGPQELASKIRGLLTRMESARGRSATPRTPTQSR